MPPPLPSTPIPECTYSTTGPQPPTTTQTAYDATRTPIWQHHEWHAPQSSSSPPHRPIATLTHIENTVPHHPHHPHHRRQRPTIGRPRSPTPAHELTHEQRNALAARRAEILFARAHGLPDMYDVPACRDERRPYSRVPVLQTPVVWRGGRPAAARGAPAPAPPAPVVVSTSTSMGGDATADAEAVTRTGAPAPVGALPGLRAAGDGARVARADSVGAGSAEGSDEGEAEARATTAAERGPAGDERVSAALRFPATRFAGWVEREEVWDESAFWGEIGSDEEN